jgi:hypothetical protein
MRAIAEESPIVDIFVFGSMRPVQIVILTTVVNVIVFHLATGGCGGGAGFGEGECPRCECRCSADGKAISTPTTPYLDWVDGEEFKTIGRTKVGEIVSDKVHWMDIHRYYSMYQKYLQPYRDLAPRKFNMLEIGAGPDGGGRGYRLYKAYAPNLMYHCVEYFNITSDILNHKHLNAEEKAYLAANTMQGDQSKPADLRAANERYGPFDIIIDDGGHTATNQRTTFEVMFPLLKPGGTFIVEDLQTSFHERWGGGEIGQRTRTTMVAVIKDLIAGLHYHWWADESYGQKMFVPFTLRANLLEWVQTVDCDREICAIRKRTQPLQKKRLTAM